MKPENCAYCGDLQDLPFECNYCKDPFCAEHRLPELFVMETKINLVFLEKYLEGSKINLIN